MLSAIFSDRPNVELLQWLARGSLKQNLLRAIRLWVWLRFLYTEDGLTYQRLVEPFTYAGWRDAFFGPNHTLGEEIPEVHSTSCACARTAADWLFDAGSGVSELEWRRLLQEHDAIPDVELDQLLQQRLFGVTRRSLYADLQILVELGWINRKSAKYYRVSEFPNRPLAFGDGSLVIKLNALEIEKLENLAALWGMSKDNVIKRLIGETLLGIEP